MNEHAPLTLEIYNHDLYDFRIQMGITALWVGASLDYVLSDILTFSIIPDVEEREGKLFETGGFHVDSISDGGFRNAVYDGATFFDTIQPIVCDTGNHLALEKLLAVREFMDICESFPKYMNFDSLKLFLAIRQIDYPVGHDAVIPKNGKDKDGNIPDYKKISRDYNELLHRQSLQRNCLKLYESTKDSFDYVTTYEFWGYADLALTILYIWLESGLSLKQCEWCGNWFSPSRENELYCERTAPGEIRKTCKEAAKYQKQLEREHSSAVERKRKSISTMLSRRRDTETDPIEKIRLIHLVGDFQDESREFKKQIKAGVKAEEEYMAFLDYYNDLSKRKAAPNTENTEDGAEQE